MKYEVAMSFVIVNLICVAVLVFIDQAIKLWASAVLAPVGSMPLIPHVLELRFCLNEGAAFSLFSGRQGLLIAVTSVALLAVAWYLFFKCRGPAMRWERAAMILILAGGLGNLIDRVANQRVVDYLNFLFIQYPIFNFADICVCVGVMLFVLCVLLEERKKESIDKAGNE